MCLQCVESAEKVMKQLATLYRNAKKKKKNCWIAISMLEARQGGAGDSLGPMWKAGL